MYIWKHESAYIPTHLCANYISDVNAENDQQPIAYPKILFLISLIDLVDDAWEDCNMRDNKNCIVIKHFYELFQG